MAGESTDDLRPLLLMGFEANVLTFVNGVFSKELSSLIDSEATIEIKNFSEAPSEVLEKYFAKSAVREDAFTSLNTAFADQGAYIRVPSGKKVLHPVVLHFVSDLSVQPVFAQLRNLIIAEKNSELTVVENFQSTGNNTGLVNSFTELFLQQDAIVDYYKIQTEGASSFHVGSTRAVHEGKSKFSSTTITLGGAITRNNLTISLNSEHSETFLYGLYLLKGKMHVDNHSLVDHAKPNCYSNELYKGVLSEKSTGVFNGKILVRQDAQKTNAFQSNKNILLSAEATMNTKPQLEIFADDVKCSHGATVGQLNEEPLFYLRSRGLSEQNAKALLMLAFAEDVIENIKIQPLKEAMKQLISESLSLQ